MKKQELYEVVLNDAKTRFKEKFFSELQDESFPWEKLILLICEEDGPLQYVFGEATVAFGKLYDNANKLYIQASSIEEMDTHGKD